MPALRRSVNFAVLKQTVSILQVLDRYGLLQGLHRNGESLSGPCPLHEGHNPTQFRVSLSKNCWVCFGDCQAGGSVIDFVSRKEGIGIRDAALLLQEWFTVPASAASRSQTHAEPRQVKTPGDQNQFNPPLRFRLQLRGGFDAYLTQRGLTAETIRTFGLGYCAVGCMAGRIVIPIHNHAGQLVAYAGRWPGTPPDGTPKYKLPHGFRRSLEVFNLHRALTARPNDPLIVVEGFCGCMAVWQAGFRRVVALMGCSLSEIQAALIVEAAAPSRRVLLLFDEDNTGRKAREKVREQLSSGVEVSLVPLPAGAPQPDHASKETLCALLA